VVSRRAPAWWGTAGFYALAALFMLPTVFVFYWMITLSLKPQVEATAYPPSFFRFSMTLKGYREVFTKYPFLLYTWNSLVVALGSTALGWRSGSRPRTRSPAGASGAWPSPSWWPGSSPASRT
jgi:ABC-type glycerol-3-phosphate transport system permease component